jgi:predicted transcriptional regulator of viral defense system
MSLEQDAYFSHYTAMQLHGLTEQIPKVMYLNVEQHASG